MRKLKVSEGGFSPRNAAVRQHGWHSDLDVSYSKAFMLSVMSGFSLWGLLWGSQFKLRRPKWYACTYAYRRPNTVCGDVHSLGLGEGHGTWVFWQTFQWDWELQHGRVGVLLSQSCLHVHSETHIRSHRRGNQKNEGNPNFKLSSPSWPRAPHALSCRWS